MPRTPHWVAPNRAASSVFVPHDVDASPSPAAAGAPGGVAADVMGGMVDAVGAAWHGHGARAARDVADMAGRGSPGAARVCARASVRCLLHAHQS
jgi:hypothetical protein